MTTNTAAPPKAPDASAIRRLTSPVVAVLIPGPVHSLATLGEAAEALGLSRAQTLAAATELYEAGLISYPRTASGEFPPFIAQSILQVLAGLQLSLIHI